MATVNVNFRLDSTVKSDMELACRTLGLSMSTAFTIFAKKVAREQRIPFEVSVDPFYSEKNIDYIKRAIKALNAGEGVEHGLIEEE